MGANKSKLKNLLTYRKIEKLYFTNCSGNLIHLIFWIGLDTNSFSQEVTLRVDSNFYSYFILSTILVKIFATRDLCKTLFLNYHSLLQLVSKTSLFSYSLIFSRSSFIYSWLPWNRKLRIYKRIKTAFWFQASGYGSTILPKVAVTEIWLFHRTEAATRGVL